MPTNTSNTQFIGDREFVMVREFAAPRDLVFEVFSTCEHLEQWFAPDTFSIANCEMDFRVGGSWSFSMRSAEGDDFFCQLDYSEIEPPNRIVYRAWFPGAGGDPAPPARIDTLTFTEHNGVTTIEWHFAAESKQSRDALLGMGQIEGTTMTLNNLDSYLETLQKEAHDNA